MTQRSAPFTDLAKVYDAILGDTDYEGWCEFVLEQLGKLGFEPRPHQTRMLDLACGTGSSAAPYVRRGFRVVGVDRSKQMLEVARQKLPNLHFFEQSFLELDLPERFDLGICVFDSLNNLTNPQDLALAFRRVAAQLKPGAWFVFDLNTPLGVAELWDDDRIEGEVLLPSGSVRYRWLHRFDPETGLGQVTACFGAQLEFVEEHFERGYWPDQVQPLLEQAGFQKLVFLDPEGGPPDLSSPRIWCFAQKTKKSQRKKKATSSGL